MSVGQIFFFFLHFNSPLYSAEVTEEAMEPFSQSLSMFLLDALLSTGNDSIEHTDPALKDALRSQTNDHRPSTMHRQHGNSYLCDSAPPETTLSASVAKDSVDPR